MNGKKLKGAVLAAMLAGLVTSQSLWTAGPATAMPITVYPGGAGVGYRPQVIHLRDTRSHAGKNYRYSRPAESAKAVAASAETAAKPVRRFFKNLPVAKDKVLGLFKLQSVWRLKLGNGLDPADPWTLERHGDLILVNRPRQEKRLVVDLRKEKDKEDFVKLIEAEGWTDPRVESQEGWYHGVAWYWPFGRSGEPVAKALKSPGPSQAPANR